MRIIVTKCLKKRNFIRLEENDYYEKQIFCVMTAKQLETTSNILPTNWD